MNYVVLLWVLISLLGFLVSIKLVRETTLDLRALGDRANGRRVVARSRRWREACRVSVHLAYIIAGLTALDVLPFGTGIIVPILIYGNLGMLFNSLVDARTRPSLYHTREGEPEIDPSGEGL